MALYGNKPKGGGLMDVIRCDEPSYLIWKWHPEGTIQGGNKKEDSIRWGSSLRVKAGSVAAFVYTRPDGNAVDYIEGPYDGFLETKNFPVITGLLGLAYDGNTPFQAEVYFINLAQVIQTKIAIPFFDVFEPGFEHYGVPVAVRGTISFKITDYKEFIALHRLENFTIDLFQAQIKDAVSRYVKGSVTNIPIDHGIPVVQLERKIAEINDVVENNLKKRLFNDFGVTVSGVDIAAIDVDKTSEGYKKLIAITDTKTVASTAQEIKKTAANTELEIKEKKLGIFQRAAKAFVDIKEEAYAKHKQTQSGNIAAYQTETAGKVGVAGAEGLGNLGSNGGGNVAGGMNPAAMMAGMAVGSAIGQNMAGTMNNMMGNINNQTPASPTGGIVPPPIPVTTFYLAVNGQASGPHDINAIAQMVDLGQVTKDSLVWKQGMSNWMKAEEVMELASLFISTPPEMPPIPSV